LYLILEKPDKFLSTLLLSMSNTSTFNGMPVNIRRIISEDINSKVNQYEVLYELITNAIQANATEITCKLKSNDSVLGEEDGLDLGMELGVRKVDTITVVDNGEGFTNANYNSFCTYRTDHKQALGCKGVGRFIFLKIYENAKIESKLKKEKKVVSFKFHPEYDIKSVKRKKDESVKKNQTEIVLATFTPQYYDLKEKVDRRIKMDLEKIRNKVLTHLIPTLFFYRKNKNKKITINFVDENSKKSAEINEHDIPNFDLKEFDITDRENKVYTFKLYYQINVEDGPLHAYHCANNRSVCPFSEKRLRLSLPQGYSGYFLLESDYLNAHVNNERNDFAIYPVKTEKLFMPISWDMINSKLKAVITEIFKLAIPETEKVNIAKLRDIEQERPYLVNYIDEQDIEMAGYLNKEDIIEKAKKRFDDSKETILTNAGKDSYTDAELNDAIQLAQNELVSYINDRVQVIERLKTMVDKEENVESLIHNLFMQMNTDDDYFSVGKNNLWLLDDRYTSYSYAASNKHIKHVLAAVGADSTDVINTGDQPDISLFFSQNPQSGGPLKSVLIELKPFDIDKKSHRKKFAGIQQLRDYVKAFKDKERIDEISAFLITEIDDAFAESLKEDEFKPLFSTKIPIYFRPYPTLNVSIYVVSASTLISDAEARNRVFLDIIRKQSRLNKMLEQTELESVDNNLQNNGEVPF
jgi:hypothetical protein